MIGKEIGKMREFIHDQLKSSLTTLAALDEDEGLLDTLERAARKTASALVRGRKLMVAGNGGSAADSQHVATEFVSRFTIDRPALRAIALTTDSSCLTGIGNDFGYDRVFERQIEALGQKGDVFLAISTSGNSPNILAALTRCRTMKIVTVGLTGGTGGKMIRLCDHGMVVPSRSTQNVEESHLVLEHIFCGLVEQFLFCGKAGRPRYYRPESRGESDV